MKLEKFEIKSHEFRHAIEFQAKTGGIDEEGLPIDGEWTTYFKTRAKVLSTSSTEKLQAKEVSVEIDKTFYIRARRDKVITEKNRILYKGDYYNIVYLNNVQDGDLYIEIKAKLIK